MKINTIAGGVCAAKGFRAAGVPARIKYEGRNDVALIVADAPCAAAAVCLPIGRRRSAWMAATGWR